MINHEDQPALEKKKKWPLITVLGAICASAFFISAISLVFLIKNHRAHGNQAPSLSATSTISPGLTISPTAPSYLAEETVKAMMDHCRKADKDIGLVQAPDEARIIGSLKKVEQVRCLDKEAPVGLKEGP